jgi:hypothetical protein
MGITPLTRKSRFFSGLRKMAGRFYLEMTRIFGEQPNKALARELGIDHTSIIQWKRGAEPSRDTIRRICERKGWSTAEYDRLNRVAEGIAPETQSEGDHFLELLFKTFAGSPATAFPPEFHEKIMQFKREYVDTIWKATPSMKQGEEIDSSGADDEPSETDVLRGQIEDRDARIKDLETRLVDRDMCIVALHAEIDELKAPITKTLTLARGIVARRKGGAAVVRKKKKQQESPGYRVEEE